MERGTRARELTSSVPTVLGWEVQAELWGLDSPSLPTTESSGIQEPLWGCRWEQRCFHSPTTAANALKLQIWGPMPASCAPDVPACCSFQPGGAVGVAQLETPGWAAPECRVISCAFPQKRKFIPLPSLVCLIHREGDGGRCLPEALLPRLGWIWELLSTRLWQGWDKVPCTPPQPRTY